MQQQRSGYRCRLSRFGACVHVRSRVPALSFGVNILHAPSGAHVNSYQRAPPAFWRPLRSNHPKDMSIYALSYYSAVINISANTANVAVRRVRIRANAFNCRNTDTRSVPWQSTVGGNGPPVILLQGRNCEISDSDIYATWIAIESRGHYGLSSPAHSVRSALVRLLFSFVLLFTTALLRRTHS